MLDPDPTTRAVQSHAAPPGTMPLGSNALQILTTEHWSLLASRSLTYTESMSRATLFIASLSGAVIALALVGQATDFGRGFVAFGLVLLPVVFFLGVVTAVRLMQVGWEDAMWVIGMNRIRHAYLELAPELERYFVTSPHDDVTGILLSSLGTPGPLPAIQPFLAIPGMIAVVDSVVAAAMVGIAAKGLDLGIGWSLLLGGAAFLVTLGALIAWAMRQVAKWKQAVEPRFPTPS